MESVYENHVGNEEQSELLKLVDSMSTDEFKRMIDDKRVCEVQQTNEPMTKKKSEDVSKQSRHETEEQQEERDVWVMLEHIGSCSGSSSDVGCDSHCDSFVPTFSRGAIREVDLLPKFWGGNVSRHHSLRDN